MAQEPQTRNTVLRPRFKGIENLLRKIAFNLGNTPSQTEVKIISCIPIDVTDLQNKIVELERELDERDRGRDSTPPPEEDSRQRNGSILVHTAIGAPTYTPAAPLFSDQPTAGPETNQSSHSLQPEPPSRASFTEVESNPLPDPQSSIEVLPDDTLDSLDPNWSESYDDTKRNLKNLTSKVKRTDKRKGKAQMVYFAQTVYPKNMEEELARHGRKREQDEQEFNRTYLTEIVKRQYRPEPLPVEPSTSSRFSWPVCRDEPADIGPRPPCDSDICSCCHGLFNNVDKANSPDSEQTPNLLRQDCSVYYDSSLYDIVPVKERPSRIMMDNSAYQKRQNDMFLDKIHLPTKPRVQFQEPCIANYCTVPVACRAVPKLRNKKKLPNKSVLKREQVIKAMQKRKQYHQLKTEACYSGCVDCGHVYMKPLYSHPIGYSPPVPPPPPPSPPSPPRLLKHAGCLTTNLNETECQTSTSRSMQIEPVPPEENKTEITLNQIKNILHAVLTEVKTSALTKQVVTEDKCTKDAVIQNGPSHSNIAANSSFVNSYLYSSKYSFYPYGPPYASQGQTAGNQGFYQPRSGMSPQGHVLPCPDSSMSGAPPGPSPCAGAAKCFQNYPLFIHTPGRQCACCYRNVPAKLSLTPACATPANVPANNEANKGEIRNKETNNLIREIYKSLAVSMNYSQRPPSSATTECKSTVNDSKKKFELKVEPKIKPKAVASEVFPEVDKRPPVFLSKGLGNKFGSTAASFRTEVLTMSASGRTECATPRGDGVRSLMPVQKELISTSSDSPQETHGPCRSPTERDRGYTPSENRDRRYSPALKSDRGYSPPDKRDRGYSSPEKRDRGRSHSEKRNREYLASEKHGRGHSPPDSRGRGYSPRGESGRRYTAQTPETSVSDEDTTASVEDSEESETTIVDTDKTDSKKDRRGLFSKMKKLFTTRTRRRRKLSDISSDAGPEPTSDSDDYETIYSDRSSRSGKHTKYRSPSPPPVPRHRRHQHSKPSLRYHTRQPPTPHSPRYRREPPAPQRSRRSPYMEQEYRRHWTEDLTFHRGDMPRFSSERPFTRSGQDPSYGSRPPPDPRCPYWREYEARHAAVPPPQYPTPPLPAPPLYPPSPLHAPFRRPYPPPQQSYPREQVSKCGQTTSLPMAPATRPAFNPQSYKPAKKGLAWLKNLNTPGFQCGVQWKNFFLDG